MDKITAKTGDAEIKQLGHTKADRFGLNSNSQVKGPKAVTNESPK